MFFIWTHGEEKLALFSNDLNYYHPNSNFTHESNKEHIVFLDLNVKLLGNNLSTDLYIKSTERHQYLHYTSSHPQDVKLLSNLLSRKRYFKKIFVKRNHGFHRGDSNFE